MRVKWLLLLCLTAFLNLTNAQEEMPPIDLIELLGELDESETQILEEAMSDIDIPNSKDNKQIESTGTANENTAE